MTTKKNEMKKAKAGSKASTKDSNTKGRGKGTKVAGIAPEQPATGLVTASSTEVPIPDATVAARGKRKAASGASAAPDEPATAGQARAAAPASTAASAGATNGVVGPVPAPTGAIRGKRGQKAAAGPAAPTGAPTRPLARDPRLPAAGTILRKLDRTGAVRCECTVEENGVRYAGTSYRSLSAAASAAAKDLGVKGAQNGYVFWGLVKIARQPAEAPLVRLEKAWERYASCARSVLADAPIEEKRQLFAAIDRHRETELDAA